MRRPYVVYVTGIDGTGKSTLARNIVSYYIDKGIRATYIYANHWPILLMPFKMVAGLLFLRGKNIFDNYNEYSEAKRKGSTRHRVFAVVYAIIWALDYIFQYYFYILTRALGKELVILDRCVFDVAINMSIATQCTFEQADLFVRWFFRLCGKPNRVILIDIPEDIAISRKTDTPAYDYLVERRELYLRLVKQHDGVILDGLLDQDSVSTEAIGLMENRGFYGGK